MEKKIPHTCDQIPVTYTYIKIVQLHDGSGLNGYVIGYGIV